MTATIVNDVFNNKISIKYARCCVIILSIPIVILASKNADIMRLFLIADLYSTIVAVIVIVAFVDRLKKENVVTLTKKNDDMKKIKSSNDTLAIGVDEQDITCNDEKTNNSMIQDNEKCEKNTYVKKNDFYINGIDGIVGMIMGIISIILFGWAFHKSFEEGIKLLVLPNGMSVEGESLGVFLSAPIGTFVGMIISAFVRWSFRKIHKHHS